MVPKICSIPECDRPFDARGWCGMHYRRWKNHGSPMALVEQRTPWEWTPEQRFWDKVDRSGNCWVWTSRLRDDGYANFKLEGRMIQAHRVSYAWSNGPIPAGMQIDHACLNRACVNPAHLRLATHKQNMENLSGARRNSKSGVRGVHWHKVTKKWTAVVRHNKESFYLGLFEQLADAEAAAIAKRNELFTHNLRDRIPA